MKIVEKIVTSSTPPQQLNVVWHNSDTNELKIWGNKGWELVGGNPNASSGGYPVVTVEKDFNIEAQPNTFYNIKNGEGSEVSISFKDDEFGVNKNKTLLFYMDEEHVQNLDPYQMIALTIATLGIFVTPNSEYEGFKYKAIVSNPSLLEMAGLKDIQFFISDIPTDDLQDETSSIDVLMIDDTLLGGSMTVTLPYIYTINNDIDYIAYTEMILSNPDEGNITIQTPIVFTQEVGHDSDKGYIYSGYVNLLERGMQPCTLYTQDEYTKVDKVIIEISGQQQEFPMTVQANKELTMPDEIKEFVFNLKSPANIVLSHPVSWNNGNIPDFTKSGTYTLSILNGVGCYTFI